MKHPSDAPTVLLPIETVNRELDANLVIASLLAKSGIRTIVGHKELCEHIGISSKRVLCIGKDAFTLRLPPTSNDHIADRLKANGSLVIFYQDEGGIFAKHEWARTVLEKHRVDFIRTRDIAGVSVWGKRQQALIAEQLPHKIDQIIVTGCPRLDLCLPSYDWVQRDLPILTRTNGDPYLLMCSRFGSIAHLKGLSKFFMSVNERQHLNIYNERLSTWQRDLHDFVEFIVLAKEIAVHFPKFKLVVRPHPSEDLGFYQTVFSPFENVLVTNELTAMSWIRYAQAVIHCNCTTGVEAALAIKPVLNFLPFPESRSEHDKVVADEAGLKMTSVPEALEKLTELLARPIVPYEWSTQAKVVLNNLVEPSLPIFVSMVLETAQTQGLTSSQVKLPSRSLFGQVGARLRRNPVYLSKNRDPYLVAKRGALPIAYIEQLLDVAAQNNVGTGQISEHMETYVIIE